MSGCGLAAVTPWEWECVNGLGRGKSPIDVPLTRAELPGLFAGFGFARGVEVGVERGEFSAALCAANPRLELTAVDAWLAYRGYREHVTQDKLEGFYRETVERLRPYPNAVVERGWSTAVAPAFKDGSLDFVYIDANHRFEHVVADLAAWVPKVRRGGIVAGHDYRHIKGKAGAIFGVVEAVNGWTRAYDVEPWFVLRGDHSPTWLWVQR